jgi:hypothetical protein
MALTKEELDSIGSFLKSELSAGLADVEERLAAKAAASVPAENHGAPDAANDASAGPSYYVHLANGDVITSQDSASTHMTVDGKTVQVIGHYTVGA